MTNQEREILGFYISGTLITSFMIILIVLVASTAFGAEVDTTKAVIHHTASGDVSASTIDRWHKERGWDGIGYHMLIRADGTVEKGRSLKKQGAHALGRNQYIGIALTGHDKFTTRQLDALVVLLKRLGVKYVERHHDFCPGMGLNVEQIQEAIQ